MDLKAAVKKGADEAVIKRVTEATQGLTDSEFDELVEGELAEKKAGGFSVQKGDDTITLDDGRTLPRAVAAGLFQKIMSGPHALKSKKFKTTGKAKEAANKLAKKARLAGKKVSGWKKG